MKVVSFVLFLDLECLFLELEVWMRMRFVFLGMGLEGRMEEGFVVVG